MANSEFWHLMPDPMLLHIFTYLSAKDLLSARRTCRNWHRLGSDEFLWKHLLRHDYKIDKSIPLPPGKHCSLNEYKRLKFHTPTVETEVLSEHTHQVLHVSFSHNGKLFASSSKDGYIKVWKTTYPAEVCHSMDMKHFSWNYTQFSQFNESDTLLLVSGVHFGAHTASGEIAVFNLQGNFNLQCRVLNKPYDIFGTWYTDDYLFSGRLQFLGHLVSFSDLWLNKAWQESESEKKPIVKRLFRFYNQRASSIRTITVAKCLVADTETNSEEQSATPSTSAEPKVHGNPVSRDAVTANPWTPGLARGRMLYVAGSDSRARNSKVQFTAESKGACTMDSPIRYSQEYRRAESSELRDLSEEEENTSSDFEHLSWDEECSGLSDDENKLGTRSKRLKDDTSKRSNEDEEDAEDSMEEDTSIEKILDHREKFLIFTTGSQTYTPHQIGFKRIKPFRFAEKSDSSLSQKLADRKQPLTAPSVINAENFDKVDHIIDLHGHIIGMGLSPDHRYLYVNSRPWPQDYHIDNPLTPPPIAQEIDIHVIDLVTFKEVGTMLRSHKAFTPNDECFFIFLDVSDQYVASGAEDRHGYLWDRHYGNCLAKLPHNDVVNSVAFNPRDPEMLVTASDDFTLKIWRSKNRVRELNVKEVTTGPQNAECPSSLKKLIPM